MRSGISIISALLILYTSQVSAVAPRQDLVVVTLRGRVEPTSNTINVEDVASVKGGDLLTRRKIAQLDLAELDGSSKTSKLSKDRVILRILLSGIAKESFAVTGPANVLLKNQDQKLGEVGGRTTADSRILDYLRAPIASRLGVPSEDVRLRIVRPISDQHRLLLESDTTLEDFLTDSIRVGLQSAKIGIRKDGQLLKTMVVSLDVQLVREVFIANRRLEPGTLVTEADLRRERRPLGGQLAKHVSTVPFGQVTRKVVPAGAVLSDLDLRRNARKPKEYVVGNRDTVEIRVQRNSLRVIVTGAMALQRGAVGDAIRVKNPNSGKVLTAHVVDSGIVEIRL